VTRLRGIRGGVFVFTLLIGMLGGCSAAPTGPSSQPRPSSGMPGSSAPAPSGGGGGGSDYCSLFTGDELGPLVGAPVTVGDLSDLYGQGCRWVTADGSGVVIIEVEQPAGLYNDIAGEDGQHAVSGIGDQALVGPAGAGGTQAAATSGDNFFFVRVDPAASDDAVIGLLRDLVARAGG